MTTTLNKVPREKTVMIQNLESSNKGLKTQLEILGFLPGTQATVVATSFFSGPITVLLRGTKISIRQSMAACIAVNPS